MSMVGCDVVVAKESNGGDDGEKVDARGKCCGVELDDVMRGVVVVVFFRGAFVVVTKGTESERVVAGDFVDVVGDKDFFCARREKASRE